jgi:hypothetical protein
MCLLAAAAFASSPKPAFSQAGNDDVDVTATITMERQAIQQDLGADLGTGYVLVRVKVTPKSGTTLRVSPDDFTLLSRKDGQRSPALEPAQIAGQGALIVKASSDQPGGDGTRSNGPVWSGVTATKAKDGENPLLPKLKEKILPDKEVSSSAEGLLYFALDGKLKTHDMTLLYKGPAGRLVIDFK